MQKDNYFVFTHKDITCPVGYEIIDNRNSELDHRIWSELSGFKIVYDRVVALSEDTTTAQDVNDMWLYLNQYRRRFPVDCYRRTYIPQPMMFQCTLAQQYDYYHSIDDLQLCGRALKEIYPHLADKFEQVLNQNIFVPYIIGVMTGAQFRDYFDFLYKVLSRTLELAGCRTYEEIEKRVKEGNYSRQNEGRNNDPAYQCRIVSFLAERLATLYWRHISTQMPVFPAEINLLEEGMKI